MDNLVVEVDGGLIKGEILSSELNKAPYYSFKGVPYARPPVGSLRFKPPDEHVEKWAGVKQCTEERDACSQIDLYGKNPGAYFGSEDCLYLNIFAPVENPSKSLRPVMVYIHGGGFIMGSKDSENLGPDFLVPKGVVLVTINYRLHIFGFLNLGIDECPGNMGLLDQRAALIWVKKHIQKFGGDPANVTIFGESAGSACVHHQLLSPLSKGLYHKAILQSGTVSDRWAFNDHTSNKERAFRIGSQLGCKTTDVKELHEFLLGVSEKTLTELSFTIITPKDREGGLHFPFAPSKEVVGDVKDKFISDDPKILLKNAIEVPVLCGITNAEGLLLYLEHRDKLSNILESADYVFDVMFPKDLANLTSDPARLKAAKSKLKQFYTRGELTPEIVANYLVDYYGDIMFGHGHYEMLKAYLSSPVQKPLYSYLYAFESNTSLARDKANLPSYLKGACHADDVRTLFLNRTLANSVLDSEACLRVVDNMTTIWTNFAKFGDPNGDLKIKWEPISSNKVSYCKIDEELKIQPGFIHEERMKFWEELHGFVSN